MNPTIEILEIAGSRQRFLDVARRYSQFSLNKIMSAYARSLNRQLNEQLLKETQFFLAILVKDGSVVMAEGMYFVR